MIRERDGAGRDSCGIDFNQSIFALQLHSVTMKITEAEKKAIDS